MNLTRAFTIYGGSGEPLVHIIPVENEVLNEVQMSMLMEVFEGEDNAENWISWEEAE